MAPGGCPTCVGRFPTSAASRGGPPWPDADRASRDPRETSQRNIAEGERSRRPRVVARGPLKGSGTRGDVPSPIAPAPLRGGRHGSMRDGRIRLWSRRDLSPVSEARRRLTAPAGDDNRGTGESSRTTGPATGLRGHRLPLCPAAGFMRVHRDLPHFKQRRFSTPFTLPLAGLFVRDAWQRSEGCRSLGPVVAGPESHGGCRCAKRLPSQSFGLKASGWPCSFRASIDHYRAPRWSRRDGHPSSSSHLTGRMPAFEASPIGYLLQVLAVYLLLFRSRTSLVWSPSSMNAARLAVSMNLKQLAAWS